MQEKEIERLKELKKIETGIYDGGVTSIAGIDEAGRGPLAGPVVVACVVMNPESMIEGVNDSKKISEKKRERIYEVIINEAIAYGVGIVSQTDIDRINILNATKMGLRLAIKDIEEDLKKKKRSFEKPDIILVDALSPTKVSSSFIFFSINWIITYFK